MNMVNWDPSVRILRQFAVAMSAFLVAMATVAHAHGANWATVGVVATLCVGIGVTAWVRPEVLRVPYVLMTLATHPIGTVLSHAILLMLFFVVITPLGLLARVVRRDPLNVRWDPSARSYWRSRPHRRDPSSYLRQA